MPSTTPMNPVPKGMLWTGRVLSALVTLFMLFDGTIKVIKLPAAMEGTAKLGYPLTEVFPLGVVFRRCYRNPGSRAGCMVYFPSGNWHADLGRTIPARR